MYTLYTNKRAYFDYEITQTREAGIVLLWHEVKSLKQRHASLAEAIVKVTGKSLTIVGMQISLYEKTSPVIAGWYTPKRPRQLLVHKKELAKIAAQTTKTGLTMVLLDVYVTKNHRIKVKIGLGKLRRKVEKKQILKEKDVDRQAKRDIKALRL